ncbi:hypothetical protein MTO96_001479 [Rhipicephalus appendiculatus]
MQRVPAEVTAQSSILTTAAKGPLLSHVLTDAAFVSDGVVSIGAEEETRQVAVTTSSRRAPKAPTALMTPRRSTWTSRQYRKNAGHAHCRKLAVSYRLLAAHRLNPPHRRLSEHSVPPSMR